MSEGPIPWTAIAQYAAWTGLDVAASQLFTRIVMTLDATYLEWREKNRSK